MTFIAHWRCEARVSQEILPPWSHGGPLKCVPEMYDHKQEVADSGENNMGNKMRFAMALPGVITYSSVLVLEERVQ